MRGGGGTKVPVDSPTFVQGTGTGLTGIYWDNPDYTDHRITRIDPVVDFSWGAQTPDPSIAAPTFSAKWVGQVQAQHSEVYTFIIEAPGGYDGTVILNEQIIIDSQYGETTIAYSTPTALVAGQWYDIEVAYRSYGGTAGIKLKWSCPSDYPGGLIQTSFMRPTVLPAVPTGIMALSTGSGKVTVYWDRATGAAGYNVYRGASVATIDYLTPVNGSTPISSTTFPGSSTFIYTNSGLVNGTKHYFAVKAVYGSWILSSPSATDFDTVDPEGVPWDTNDASQILSTLAARAPDPITGEFRALAPDGSVYSSQSGSRLQPDGMRSPDTNFWSLADGTDVTTSEEELFRGPFPPTRTGPIRRVRSAFGFKKASAKITLPIANDILRTPYIYPSFVRRKPVYPIATPKAFTSGAWSSDDVPYIYLGSSANNDSVEVDAGVMWQYFAPAFSFRWRPFIRYSGQRDPLLLDQSAIAPTFEAGSIVRMTYYFGKPTQINNGDPESDIRNVFFKIQEEPGGDPVVFAAAVKGHPASASTVRLKRCHSIAQSIPQTSGDWSQGYRVTGSYCFNAKAEDVRVYTSATDTVGLLWSAGPSVTFESIGYPAGRVTWSSVQAHSNEVNIRIDLR